MTSPPTRLLDDPSLSADERALLSAGVSTSPVNYDVDAGLARFRAAAVGLTAAAAVTHAGTAKALLAQVPLKLALAVAVPVVGAAVTVGIVQSLRDEPVLPPATSVVVPVVRTTPPPAPVEKPAPAVREEREREPEPETPRKRHAPTPHHAPAAVHLEETDETTTHSEPAPEAPSSAVLEMRALAKARGLLSSDPAAALSALEKMQRDHPRGYFVEERRALTVLAFARAGNRTAASNLGAAFVKRYPSGPFTDRVREAMAR